jgi:acyl dehydratase
MRLLITQGPVVAGGTIGAGGELAWPTPTRPGDHLHLRIAVESLAPSRSDPTRGSTMLRIETLTSDDEVRQVFTVRTLLFARPPGSLPRS